MHKPHKCLALLSVLVLFFCITGTAAADLTAEEYAQQAFIVPTRFAGKTVILHSNDVHGAIEGYAFMTELRSEIEAKGGEVIMVDSGDFSQGSIYVSTSKGHAAVEMMNTAGYDVVSLGNHEFDYGYAQLMENLADARFRTVCSNVLLDETGAPILDPATVITTSSGLKLGFVGITTPETVNKVNPGLIHEISFPASAAFYASVQSAVDSLTDANLVIGLSHLGMDEASAELGYRAIDLYNNVSGFDMLIDGHSHTVMTGAEGGEPIQSAGSGFQYIGVIVINNETAQIENHYLVSTAGLQNDPEVAAAAQEIMDSVDAQFNTVFATSEVLLSGEENPGCRTEETNLGDLITDAMVWTMIRTGGTDQVDAAHVVGIINGGALRASIEPGDITMREINTVLPFDNTIAVVYVTGAELLEALEASTFATPQPQGSYPQTSGLTFTLDTTRPYAQGSMYSIDGKESGYYAPASIERVTITSVNGTAFDPEALYAVVTNNYCAAGGDTYNIFNRAISEGSGFDSGMFLGEALVDYITSVQMGTITAEAYGEPRGSQTQIR